MKFTNTQVWGFEHAIRGMRNPMNSWDKSDSIKCFGNSNCPYICKDEKSGICIGKKDLSLMQKLVKAGPEHRKFMRQIFISVDITAPMFWWGEFDTYKVGTVANSTSKMHKLATTPITLDCFEIDDFNEIKMGLGETINPQTIIDYCEKLRLAYLETKDKKYWKELVRWLPESWLQTRTVTMSYENLLTICKQRKSHKLNEWSGIDNPNLPNFIGWVKTLPYAQELIFINELEENKEY